MAPPDPSSSRRKPGPTAPVRTGFRRMGAVLAGGWFFDVDLVLWRGRAGSRPGSRNTFLSRQKGIPKRRFEHQLPRYFAQALRLRIPRTTTVSSSTVTVRDTAVPVRFGSLRIASLAHWTRWAPAFAGVTFVYGPPCVCGPRMSYRRTPVPTDPNGHDCRRSNKRARGERAKRATPRTASDRKASEAKPQTKPHASPAPPGDPWRPLGAGAKRLGGHI